MSNDQVEEYLNHLPEPQRGTLRSVQETLRGVLPTAEECITYGVPTFKLNGKAVAGFSAHKQHCNYLPMSGSVLSNPEIVPLLNGYTTTKGSLKFPLDTPPSGELISKLVEVRLAEL